MKHKYVLFFILYSVILTGAQKSFSQQWLWANQIGSDLHDGASGTTDRNGNFYISGSFDGSTCQFVSHTLNKHGNNGMFLAKYDNSGNEIWVNQFDIDYFPSGYYDGIGDLIVDNRGFIYITGIFYSSAKFGSITLSSDNGDVFIAKFDSLGNCIWAKKGGGTGKDGGSGIAIDSIYNVYICGQNTEVAFFDSISIEQGGFLAKYDSNGVCTWAKKVTSYNSEYQMADVPFSCMKIFKNNLYACGTEQATSFIIDTMNINHPGSFGHILCSFDLNGSIKWAKEGISPAAYSGINLTADDLGNLFIVGEFSDSINFNGNKLFTHGNSNDFFITKYNSNADVLWTKAIHSNTYSLGGTIISNSTGNIYVSGSFNGTIIFGLDTIISETARDMFLARYSPDGECYGGIHFGDAEGLEVALDAMGDPMVVGIFKGTVNIGSTTYTSYQNSEDIFVAKCSAINGIEEKSKSQQTQLLIYANPTTGKCNIKIPEDFRHEKNLVLQIFDNNGRMIQNIPVIMDQEKISLNISAEAKGMYNAILSNRKKSYSGKIVFN